MNICVKVCILYPHFMDNRDRNNSSHTVSRGLLSVRTRRGSAIRMLEFRSRCWMLCIMVRTSKTILCVTWWEFLLYYSRGGEKLSWNIPRMTAECGAMTVHYRQISHFLNTNDRVSQKKKDGDVGSRRIRNFNPSRNTKSRIIFWYSFTHPLLAPRSISPHFIITNLNIFLSISCSFLFVAGRCLSCSCSRFPPPWGSKNFCSPFQECVLWLGKPLEYLASPTEFCATRCSRLTLGSMRFLRRLLM